MGAARDGVSQLAFVVGEPGIGNSHLVQEFHHRLTDTPHTWVECGTAPFFQDTPFYPVVEMLQHTLALRDDCSVEGLERTFSDTGLTAEDAVPLVARMLGLPVPGKYPASFLPPEQERRKLLVVLSAWMLAVASQRPLVIVVEDLHWADPSTPNSCSRCLMEVNRRGCSYSIPLVLSSGRRGRPAHITWS